MSLSSTNRITGLFYTIDCELTMLEPAMLQPGARARRRDRTCSVAAGLRAAVAFTFILGNSTTLHATASPAPASADCCAVVELRQYTLHPGKRDVLIDLFDREFVDTQEATGITVIAQFRDLDRPDRFVWLRGFPDMPARAAALSAFYGGPAWRAHRTTANATMIDSSNVLLLEPANERRAPLPERPAALPAADRHIVVATLYSLESQTASAFAAFFGRTLRPALLQSGAVILGEYATSPQANNFPALPVREGEHVFVWLARFESTREHEAFQAALAQAVRWRDAQPELATRLQREPEILRLTPTSRSRL